MIHLGFWEKLKEKKAKIGLPIFALAPMADVTDAAFRCIVAKYGKPDVMWTEFISADGLALGGYEKLKIDLLYSESERPIVVQLFGGNPETMEKAAALVRDMGFDGLDINMGCPDWAVEKQGAGAALIKNPPLAKKIIEAAKRGAPNIPVSVKTRIGYNRNEIETWLPALLETGVAAVTVHARTRKEMSKVPAHWKVIGRAVEIRDALKSGTLIIGNGDVLNLEDGAAKARESGADGVMLGTAIFGNPALLSRFVKSENILDTKKKLKIMIEHTKLFQKLFAGRKNFAVMKKHFKAYVEGFRGARELRAGLMEARNAEKVEEIASRFINDLHAK